MKIVILDAYPLDTGDIDWSGLSQFGELIRHPSISDPEFAQAVAGADIVMTNKARIRKKDIASLKDCKLVGILATGANIVDLEALAEAGIPVCNVPGYGVEDVAQQALALLMELCRHTVLHSDSVKAGDWPQKGWSYWLKPPLCLTGLTLGIVGFGAIGQMMGSYGHSLGMNILAWSRSRKAKPAYPFQFRELSEILRESDVISLHCPLSPETERLINADSIAAMKDGAIIINTARGGLVDETAVAAGLDSGKLGGFGADVMAKEPPDPENPLFYTPNTLLTPHNAWATLRARQKLVNIMVENIKGFLAGKPQNLINSPKKI